MSAGTLPRESAPTGPSVSLASTIGPIDAGIVPALIDAYHALTGVEVKLTGAGTGKTLDLARGGGYDLVIVHARRLEEQFVAEGFGLARHELMANDFVLVGPANDPAGVRGLTSIAEAFGRLAERMAPFLTRGDRSGTHVKEVEVWEAAELVPAGDWYRTGERGTEGNVATAREAAALGCYTLLDRATVLSLGATLGFDVLVEGDPLLLNVISVIPVNPRVVSGVSGAEAARFVDWLLGDDAQRLIAEFRAAELGQPPFYPRAPTWRTTPRPLAGARPTAT